MSELERTETEPEQRALSKVGQWALDAREAHQVAQSLAKTSFVPKCYQGKPSEATAAILMGSEIGLSPMTALRSIVVIHGTPAMTAVALRGLVQSQGHRVWIEKASDQSVTAKGVRQGDDIVHESVWDIKRAESLGLMDRDQWRKQPKAMLTARATSEVCRLVSADVLLGLPYSVEELDEPEPTTTVKRKRLEPVESQSSERAEAEPAAAEEPQEEEAV
ncbi:conserved hypothetical protein [Segniliparus rotundus DSM 44985]|uniref:Uncharacterized protein n=1 Tax=Segniliparus rotundus (strain ATCC BAA-972 / CDC 1076 / CIP 108378 / DSM 44985 / JCM 13578) TaxID=640132 RepID=D6Z9J9_SEGRD|nr:hypothetical protein [Segniliparus rotundus]ADG96526.1 conserved hypothetical protein [Segniliparus rotundus DSM 44985]